MSEKFAILTNILGKSYRSGEEHLFSCPFCGHPKNKFSVNVDKNVYKCWICDARGKNIYRLIRRFGTFTQQEKWKELTGCNQDLTEFDTIFQTSPVVIHSETVIEMPQGFRTLTRASSSKSHIRCMRYLESRGLSKHDILKWKIGYTAEGNFRNRIIVPSFNEKGDLNYFIARTYTDDYRRYMNPPVSRNIIFNELYVDFEEEITIVEGIFDAMKAKNAVPILGSTIRESSKLFQKIIAYDTPILLALDPDAALKTRYIKKLFLKYGIEVREMKYEDETRDIGDMTKQEVAAMSDKAPFIHNYDTLIDAITAI